MERTFRKPAEDGYPQKIFAHQLITVDDLFQFKKGIGAGTSNCSKVAIEFYSKEVDESTRGKKAT